MRLLRQSRIQPEEFRLWNAAPASCFGHLRKPRNVLIEHSLTNSVKSPMDRVRVMFAALIPALILLASGQVIFNPPMACASQHCPTAACFCQPARQVPLGDIVSFDQSARLMIRRMAKPFGLDGFPPVSSPDGHIHGLRILHIASISAEFPFGLAQRWQFCWRTALEPRAPSSAS